MTMHHSQPYHSSMPMPVIPAQRRSAPSAPAIPAIPAQRRAPMSAPRLPRHAAPVIPVQRRPMPAHSHRAATPAPVIPAPHVPTDSVDTQSRSRVSTALDVLGQLGSAVSLSALLVVAAAIGGATDGQPVDNSTPLSITFDSHTD